MDALGEICNMIAGNFGSGEAEMKSTSQAAFDRIATILQEGDYRLQNLRELSERLKISELGKSCSVSSADCSREFYVTNRPNLASFCL